MKKRSIDSQTKTKKKKVKSWCASVCIQINFLTHTEFDKFFPDNRLNSAKKKLT